MQARVQKLRKAYFEGLGFSRAKRYALVEAIELLKAMPPARFVESLEFAIQLGIDAKRSDQNVRGAVALPHGTGKEVKVAVFASGSDAEAAQAVGADWVGVENLTEMIQKGDFPFQVLIAHPEHMVKLGRLGPILGPKGLMPNPKLGTVTADVASAVKAAKSGQVYFRNDKSGIVHGLFGRLNFDSRQLVGNLDAVIWALRRSKPSAAKGAYLKQIVIAATMSPGVKVQL